MQKSKPAPNPRIGKGFTTQFVRDINATLKMHRFVYLITATGNIRITQARSAHGQLQVKCLSSGKWLRVYEHESVEKRL